MLIKLDDPKLLSDSIAVLSELVLEVKAKINAKKFEIIALDPANVAMVHLTIPKEAFSKWEVTREEELGLNLEDFKQVLRRASTGSSVTFEKQENTLKISIQDKMSRQFNLSLINIDSEEKKLPDLSFNVIVDLASQTFSDIINDASIVADSCTLEAKENKFFIESKGTLHTSKTEFSSDEAKIAINQESKSKYSLDYFVKFIKAQKLAENVSINFSSDYPCKIDFKGHNLELSFILAPRVEED